MTEGIQYQTIKHLLIHHKVRKRDLAELSIYHAASSIFQLLQQTHYCISAYTDFTCIKQLRPAEDILDSEG